MAITGIFVPVMAFFMQMVYRAIFSHHVYN